MPVGENSAVLQKWLIDLFGFECRNLGHGNLRSSYLSEGMRRMIFRVKKLTFVSTTIVAKN